MRAIYPLFTLLLALAPLYGMDATQKKAALAGEVRTALRTHHETQDLLIQADSAEGLVVLHGIVYSRQMKDAVEQLVWQVPGVDQVYSYLIVDRPEDITASIARSTSIEVTAANMYDRTSPFSDPFHAPFFDVPNYSNDLARKVADELTLNPLVNMYDLKVHGYNGVIILHGRVNDSRAARDAEAVVSLTPGVTRVLSYLDTGPDSAEPPAPFNAETPVVNLAGAPSVFSVELTHPDEVRREEAIPAAFETRTRIERTSTIEPAPVIRKTEGYQPFCPR